MASTVHETQNTKMAVLDSKLIEVDRKFSDHVRQDREDFDKAFSQLTAIQVSIAEQKPWVTLVAQLVVTALSVGVGYWLGQR